MTHTWIPSSGISRRLFIAALAALLAFTTLALIPGTVAPASATSDKKVVDYVIIFVNQNVNPEFETTISGQSDGGDFNVFISGIEKDLH
ncbi:MAG: hypothetical protein QGD91_10630, partial [Actinomycetota bacterium]|nr:hypothetical protein [Actinomycetota bacterium]